MLAVSSGDATLSSGGGSTGAAAAAAAETSTSLATGVVAQQPSAESPQAVGETAVEGTALSMGDVKEALPEVGATARVDTAATDAAEEEVCAMLVVGYVFFSGMRCPSFFHFCACYQAVGGVVEWVWIVASLRESFALYAVVFL